MKHIATVFLALSGLCLATAPAIAGINPVGVPEPMSLSLLAGGVLAIAAIKRMHRK